MVYLFTFLLACTSVLAYAESESYAQDGNQVVIRPCARCVEAREYNLKHPNEYFYYEDYLEAKKTKKEEFKEQ